jgi:hypothetical protein
LYQVLPDGTLYFEIISGDINNNVNFDMIYVNHYWLKSEEDFKLKNQRRNNREHSHQEGRFDPLDLLFFDRINMETIKDCGFLEMPPKRN